MKKDDRERCSWATTELYKEYHDEEWGKPVHDDRKLFEMLVLEGMQAGLSWLTILNKRAAFKEAFNEFDYQKIALYDETKIDELMQNPNIVRNRLKIKSTITNAQQFIKIQEEYGSFDKFIWSYVVKGLCRKEILFAIDHISPFAIPSASSSGPPESASALKPIFSAPSTRPYRFVPILSVLVSSLHFVMGSDIP